MSRPPDTKFGRGREPGKKKRIRTVKTGPTNAEAARRDADEHRDHQARLKAEYLQKRGAPDA